MYLPRVQLLLARPRMHTNNESTFLFRRIVALDHVARILMANLGKLGASTIDQVDQALVTSWTVP